MAEVDPEKQRQFAEEVVRKLRAAGYTAYWAGGCVRDRLLRRVPKDYDVATDATPLKIRQLFRYRRTLALGAAFGVITVLGPAGAGQVEVATFRQDATYSDGRHPDSVRFSTAEEDARRRDFTINGMFFDPLQQEVIDFVGGQEDLTRHILRAIGDPHQRISEDKLRMLRAVRFAARFEFELEPVTFEAIRQRGMELEVVSAERIAAEMRQMLTNVHRVRAVQLLLVTGLAAVVLPEILPSDTEGQERLARSLAVLDCLEEPSLPLALAALLADRVEPEQGQEVCRRWRLSNKETETIGWLLAQHTALRGASQRPWSQVQPVLIAPAVSELLAWNHAEALAGQADPDDVAWCQAQLLQPRESLNPGPLLSGDDLKQHGVPPGPNYRPLLERVRQAQLDGEVQSREEALALVDRLGQAPPTDSP